MGICYYIARHDNRTLFELGKGSWSRLTGASSLAWAVASVLDDMWWGDDSGMPTIEYVRDQCGLIAAWIDDKPYEIVNDCDDSLCAVRVEARGGLPYRITGTRYMHEGALDPYYDDTVKRWVDDLRYYGKLAGGLVALARFGVGG